MQQHTGKILRFNTKNGYGFIKPDDGSADIFMHATDLVEGEEEQLDREIRVVYQIGTSHRGPKAVKVRILPPPPDLAYTDPADEAADVQWSLEDEIRAIMDKHMQVMTEELRQLFEGSGQ